MPTTIEVIAYAPTEFFHCTHCEVVWHEVGMGQKVHREQRDSAIPDDLLQDYTRLGEWIHTVVARYGDRVIVNVVDAASIEGFYKSLRHGARKYPAIIVDGREKALAGDYPRADALLADRLGARVGAGPEGGEV